MTTRVISGALLVAGHKQTAHRQPHSFSAQGYDGNYNFGSYCEEAEINGICECPKGLSGSIQKETSKEKTNRLRATQTSKYGKF